MQLVDDERVRVYTLKKGIKDTIIYDEKAVRERFGFGPKLLPDYKGLRGDPSDNIVGVPGIGEKSAEELISNFGTIEKIYETLEKSPEKFEKAGIKKRIAELLKANEEEALFSKMLATIRRDAPILWQLPEKPWRQSLDLEKVGEFFRELEFRALDVKLAEALSLELPEKPEIGLDGEGSEENVRETGLLLWIVDSNKTDPTIEDIFSWTRTKNISDAGKILEKTINDNGLGFVLEKIEKPLLPITKEMEKTGVKIDKEKLNELSKEYHLKLDSIEKKIWKEAGAEFNINSPKQLGDVLFNKLGLKAKNQKKTAGGALSTRESELEKLRDENPIIGSILEYRELAKLLGTYIDTIPNQVGEDGRLHAHFSQAGTTTGRMSSSDPNLQNIPNKTDLGREIRKSFVADSGWKLVSFDYSQIELRIAAFLSGDSKLIEIFKSGKDVHTAVASEVFGVSLEKVTKEMRSKAKVINFGVMYGMGVTALQKNIGTGRKEAQDFLDRYFANYSGLAEYLERVKRETAQRGFTETFFGRRRYFPDISSRLPFMRAAAERMAINAPIQGTEADIIKLAMVQVDEMLKQKNLKNSARLILQVHDELVYEIKDDLVKTLVPEIKKIMEGIIDPKETHGIVCSANAAAGDNWGEMREVARH
jgi:DNA polymerase-1